MQLSLYCMECYRTDRKVNYQFQTSEYLDSGVYEAVCNKGHQTTTVLQEQRWEVLSNIGAYALADGYYREAIGSYVSCYERFHEFALKVLVKPASLFGDAWKNVARQSERQLGAFIFVWSKEFGEVPALLRQDDVTFRNDVIHKGHLPTRNRTTEFCESVYSMIRSQIEQLKAYDEAYISELVGKEMAAKAESAGGGATLTIATVLSLNSPMAETFDAALNSILNIRDGGHR